MNEQELRQALDSDKVVRLRPEGPRLPTPKADALALIDAAVHLARSAGFEIIGPCEVSNARIIEALSAAMQHLKSACDAVRNMEEPS